jgi:hypothetical protein
MFGSNRPTTYEVNYHAKQTESRTSKIYRQIDERRSVGTKRCGAETTEDFNV